MIIMNTSVLLDPLVICLARDETLLTFTCTRSAKRILESANNDLALVLLADAMFAKFVIKYYVNFMNKIHTSNNWNWNINKCEVRNR